MTPTRALPFLCSRMLTSGTCLLFGWALILTGCTLTGCASRSQERPSMTPTSPKRPDGPPGSFGHDLAFLERHTALIVLKSEDGKAQVAVAPEYQGRVMTSSAEGEAGKSFGYVHRPGVELGKPTPHMSVVGGEDRFWLGPEGGNFALYFAPGAPFEFAHWQVPEPLDWGPFRVSSRSAREVSFSRDMQLVNYHGTALSLRVDRSVRLLDSAAIEGALGRALPAGVATVAYESDNRVTNTGASPWRKETGLVSIWILGMFPPGPRATVVVPVKPDAEGPIVRDDYFGHVPAERLRSTESHVFLRADGAQRGKIGVSFGRAMPVAGSYDPDARVLTLVQYTLPQPPAEYVSSTWELQQNPYAGDVINSYNDGPVAPGAKPLGPFYEIESSSPALALAPGAAATHLHRTFHFTGAREELAQLAAALLGVGLEEIENALPAP
jgi:hypothetical protein